MLYGFRTGEGDSEIDEVLSELNGKERTEFIKNAIYYYIKNKDKLDNIENGINRIENMLIEIKNSGITARPVEQNQKGTGQADSDILKSLVDEFLSF